jgi:hypothetical protein
MIIIYEVIPSEKEQNTFNAFPISVERCCQQSILWFFKYSMDCLVKEAVILKRSSSENSTYAERFNHCQFCGKKHTFYTQEEYQQVKKGIFDKIKKD